jgi:hypothetical protein
MKLLSNQVGVCSMGVFQSLGQSLAGISQPGQILFCQFRPVRIALQALAQDCRVLQHLGVWDAVRAVQNERRQEGVEERL